MEYKPKHKIKLELRTEEDAQKDSYSFVNCPSCNTQASSDDIDLSQKIAKCHSCNALFSIEEFIGNLKSKEASTKPIDQPAEVEKFYFGEELDLTISQSASALEVIVASLAPLFVFIGVALYSKEKVGLFLPIISILVFAVVITSLLNLKRHKTYLKISEEELKIEHRPKKLRKDKSLNSRRIDQVYVYSHPNAADGSLNFGLKAVMDEVGGKKHVEFIKGLKTVRAAKYIEQEIEKHLDIPNEKMLEEV